MSNAPTSAAIDLVTLRTAIESSDAHTLTGLYADDAELQVMDRLHPPSKPLVYRGKEAILSYWNDIGNRDMSHVVERIARDGDTVAYSEACLYPNGTRVQCIAFLDLANGKIARQVGVQTWDEEATRRRPLALGGRGMEEQSTYHEGSRQLQDHFDSRRIADRLEQVTLHSVITEDDRSFIQRCCMFFLATADADGCPDCSY
ncbi:MAG TPA: nuclear transport factor 2 family protein, partial [Chloroflexota bacterium]|nr:nuclear transport factor 2 family protein [Chloroflexota bacterium]